MTLGVKTRSGALFAAVRFLDQSDNDQIGSKRFSNSRESNQRAFAKYGTPEGVNTDQGNQFPPEEFTGIVLAKGCKLSMDRRGAWRDKVFVGRVWRSVKYERVYLKACDCVSAARADIAEYMA